MDKLGEEEDGEHDLGNNSDTVSVELGLEELLLIIRDVVLLSDLGDGVESDTLSEERDQGHEEEVELAVTRLNLSNVESTVDILDG